MGRSAFWERLEHTRSRKAAAQERYLWARRCLPDQHGGTSIARQCTHAVPLQNFAAPITVTIARRYPRWSALAPAPPLIAPSPSGGAGSRGRRSCARPEAVPKTSRLEATRERT